MYYIYSLAYAIFIFHVFSFCITRYLSPFELRPRFIDKKNAYKVVQVYNDDYHSTETSTFYKDCYQIIDRKNRPCCYSPSCDFFSGRCAASWYDLDHIGNTSLNKAAKDWSYYVGDHLNGIWGYAVATMVVFPLICVWPLIQSPVLSDVLVHMNSSPFLRPESWKALFPTCNVSVKPTSGYQTICTSLFLVVSCFILPCVLGCCLGCLENLCISFDRIKEKRTTEGGMPQTASFNPIQLVASQQELTPWDPPPPIVIIEER